MSTGVSDPHGHFQLLGGLRCAPTGGERFTVVDGVEDEFNAGRDAEFVEDAEEIFLDSVLAEVEFTGGFAVAEASGDEGDNLLLAGGEKFVPSGVDDTQGWNFGDEIEQETHLLGIDPDLTFGDALDATAKQAKVSVRRTENSADAGAEGANDEFTVVRLEEENLGHVRMKKMDAAKRGHLTGEANGTIKREKDDPGRVCCDRLKDGVDVDGAGGDVELGTSAQGASEKLRLHLVGVSDENRGGYWDSRRWRTHGTGLPVNPVTQLRS